MPKNSLWLNRLFINLANKNEVCLTLDCWGVNPNGQGRFKTEADKPDQETYCFKVNNNDQLYNVFISKRVINNLDDIYF